MSISEQTRNDAAEFCSVMASWWANGAPGTHPCFYYEDETLSVAGDAYCASESIANEDEEFWQMEEIYAEAEVILRSGWNPGDDLVR